MRENITQKEKIDLIKKILKKIKNISSNYISDAWSSLTLNNIKSIF
jgi:hypothetical protein